MSIIDRRGVSVDATDTAIAGDPNPGLAIKAPVRVATTAAVTLSGLQTIDGIALADGDRVLVKDQADQRTNGLYNAATGLWQRTIDADSNDQWAAGLLVSVAIGGTVNGGTLYRVTTSDPILLGTTNLAFTDTISAALLPTPTPTTLGAVFSSAAVANQFITGLGTDGIFTRAQPAFSDISGVAAAAQLPNPTPTTIGGVKSLAAVTHQFLTQIGPDGSVSQAQPSVSDISGAAALTRTNDTNVTLTLGGSPTTALLAAASLTLGWTGTLSPTRGGLGADFSSALAGQAPVFPGSGLGAIPISLPFLNVVQYGAKCDGSTEDYAAFNSAITAANAIGGGIVTAPPGSVCIIGKTGVFITLLSNTYIAGNFTLRKGLSTVNDPIVFSTGTSNVGVFGGVTIDMINSGVGVAFNNNAGIQFANTTNTLIDHVNIVNMGAFGISLNGGTYRITNNTITLNTPSIHQNQGIEIACTNASSGLIQNNTLVGTSMLTCGSQTQILSNRISGWAYGTGIGHGGGSGSGSPCGISLGGFPACDDIIGYNVITNGAQGPDENSTYTSGIENFDANTLIIGNIIVGNGGNGITQVAPSSIVNNVIVDNCTSIISVVGFPECAGIFSRYDSATVNASNATIALNQVYNSFSNLAVTGAASAAGLIRLSVASTAALGPTNTQFLCFVFGVGGTTEANGGWTCKVTGATTIDLLASAFVNAWTSGGTIGGTQAYAYSEGNASLSGIRLNANTFSNGRTGSTHVLSATTAQPVLYGTSAGPGTSTTVLHGNASGIASYSAVSLAADITGVLAGVNGGTGLSTAAVGDLIYASATTPTWSRLAAPAAHQTLISNGVNTAQSWSSTLNLDTHFAVGLQGNAPLGYVFQARQTTNQNFVLLGNQDLADGVAFKSVVDADTTLKGLEFLSSQVMFGGGGGVSIGAATNPGNGGLFVNANLWHPTSANGSVATVLGSVGPVGSHTSVQEWFPIKNAAGTVRYVPGF